MLMRANLLVACLWLAAGANFARATEPSDVRARAEKALSLAQTSAASYVEQRTCFSCHHQALRALAARSAARAGWTADRDAAKAQSEFTIGYFAKLQTEIAGGKGVVGGPYTAGYALAGLAADEWPADDTTAALVQYLFLRQEDDGRWQIQSHRPPLEDSDFTATALAIRGLRHFGGSVDGAAAEERIARAGKWLVAAEPKSHEDLTFQVLGLCWSRDDNATPSTVVPSADTQTGDEEATSPVEKAPAPNAVDSSTGNSIIESALRAASDRLLREQRSDGGWGQLPDMESDAYATGQALFALRQAGVVPADHCALRRGRDWLLAGQLEDGSWRVASRSKPFQDYFESSFPHDESQFISISATCWAVMALAEVAAGEGKLAE